MLIPFPQKCRVAKIAQNVRNPFISCNLRQKQAISCPQMWELLVTRSPIREFSNLVNCIHTLLCLHFHSFLLLPPSPSLTQSKQLSFDITSKVPLSLSSIFCRSPILLHQPTACCSQFSSRGVVLVQHGGGNPRSGR